MRDSRTVEAFVREIDHVAGVKIKVRWAPFLGLFLEDVEAKNTYPLGHGMHKKSLLTTREQESICRGLSRENLLVLLGLDPDVGD